MASGIPGSTWTPRPDTADRLRTWRRHATAGDPVEDIAARCGMTRDALDQMVVRARRHGHPDAVHHARARQSGTGTWQLTGRKASRRTTEPSGGTDR